MDRPTTYLHMISPGHRCERCGADISHRHQQTKYCSECKRQMFNEKQKYEREHYKILSKRDTANSRQVNSLLVACGTCGKEAWHYNNFCSACGQRLKEEEECIVVKTVDLNLMNLK